MKRACALALAALACAGPGPSLECRVNVPALYLQPGAELVPPPDGEPEPVRYTRAYQAFWWNCVAVRARRLDARCPFTCSGTPAASDGCAEGSSDATRDIDSLLQRFPPGRVQSYLTSLAAQPEAREKLAAYFGNTPRAWLP
ncbi:MAG TPA: hypothetical protein VMR86_21665 [Myxococcota bacterium]|nr:hypothetical protein [Myxococcota bacterium]